MARAGRRELTTLLNAGDEQQEDGTPDHTGQRLSLRFAGGLLSAVCLLVASSVLLETSTSGNGFRQSDSLIEEAEEKVKGGCCTSFREKKDKCGTCDSFQTSGYCAESTKNCKKCKNSAWCEGKKITKTTLAASPNARHGKKKPKPVSHKVKVVKMPDPAGTALKNPFEGKKYYVHPLNAAKYAKSMEGTKGKIRENLARMKSTGAAYWIETKAKFKGDSPHFLEGILKDAKSQDPVPLVTLVWYNLPNRDCAAKASIGEICCTVNETSGLCDLETETDCEDGLNEYKEGFVNPFVQILKKYVKDVPVVIILEPDSLPNLATNQGNPHCGNNGTLRAYKEGMAYAMNKLVKETPEVTVYLEAASGAWLGWAHSCLQYLDVLVEMKLPMERVRGFATNVAKYQPLGVQCPWEHQTGFSRNNFCLPSSKHHKKNVKAECCKDPCHLLDAWDPGNNEHNYAALLIKLARKKFGTNHFKAVIDTGRNGAENRKDCNNFCNIRKAGAGRASTTETANNTILDAYFWLKTPGESDGCTKHLPNGSKCARYDKICGSEDSLGNNFSEPAAPEAGEWYDFQVKELAEYADFDGTGGN
mmetsp:Transcript_107330/g.213059  ORF Transcript_107330/g.213059 Transcript_107330/m.213059 type:complete len:589 (-) Transcript_107330:459-2225(-)|eukprot:CAMPEP_0172757408 /NCGR_PEP_ID=MMETSP1074-20121228/163712_1 /TAXON_ID=2916 /ORGANISM="Ceratium fusus, Strain PA161109" /LENGTH=588 /DNA_ID=CAMNT_0013590823 /DNA_START=22 /DNA_END=1788 /DNA_ORIENTATION=-